MRLSRHKLEQFKENLHKNDLKGSAAWRVHADVGHALQFVPGLDEKLFTPFPTSTPFTEDESGQCEVGQLGDVERLPAERTCLSQAHW